MRDCIRRISSNARDKSAETSWDAPFLSKLSADLLLRGCESLKVRSLKLKIFFSLSGPIGCMQGLTLGIACC